jgi:uncharacterized membrane protein HdeD (DUF308 family)
MLNPMSSGAALDKETAEQVSKGWWIILVAGIVSVIAGVLILTIEWTVEDLAVFVAILFIVRGVFRLGSRPIDGSSRGWNLLFGALEVLVGIAFVAWPKPTLLTLAIFIGAWVLVSGIFTIIGSIANRHEVSLWWLYLIVGIIEVPLGIVLLNRPNLTLGIAIAMAGIWAVLVGTLEIVASFEVKDLPRKLGLT